MAYSIGIAEDKGTRRTMEDSHSFVVDFDDIRGQGYFGLFDGHAGKHAAEWCGQHFHEYFLKALHSHPESKIPSVLNKAFHAVDSQLSHMAAEQKTHSGCTAVVAFVRIEDDRGGQSFLQNAPPLTEEPTSEAASSSSEAGGDAASSQSSRSRHVPFEPNWAEGVDGKRLRRVLYAANAGDARAVLCRGGEALRLTYDHKGSDAQESKRITDAGGFVMNNRVNGVLAVTRSLGDSAMKDFVVGAPYTTETELSAHDEFLIIACDGLWDVTEDQEAVNLVRDKPDAQQMAKFLLEHALVKFSSDNVTVMVIRFKPVPSHASASSKQISKA
ncbi:hypothetical protein M408DRAFT_67281 [Serendipita vermifera MAFF 305830]|uniref:PPM-type phosphatase domain-containing protein n=1 Tax=Serendipita vermifera MAFF 305830 TaxID=933852 RepID=A0A0C2XLI2_SERVB|nr:hypothetical protein M408DRAFT_67281 [Serendipita vermifera MAFF 305830]